MSPRLQVASDTRLPASVRQACSSAPTGGTERPHDQTPRALALSQLTYKQQKPAARALRPATYTHTDRLRLPFLLAITRQQQTPHDPTTLPLASRARAERQRAQARTSPDARPSKPPNPSSWRRRRRPPPCWTKTPLRSSTLRKKTCCCSTQKNRRKTTTRRPRWATPRARTSPARRPAAALKAPRASARARALRGQARRARAG